MRALDHPAPRLAEDATDHRQLTTTADVRDDSALSDCVLARAIVIALVEAEMPRATWPARPSNDDRIERGGHHTHIRDVRSGRDRGDGYSLSVGQNMAFDAGFSSIRRVRTGLVPPFGAFTIELSKLDHSQSKPRPWS